MKRCWLCDRILDRSECDSVGCEIAYWTVLNVTVLVERSHTGPFLM